MFLEFVSLLFLFYCFSVFLVTGQLHPHLMLAVMVLGLVLFPPFRSMKRKSRKKNYRTRNIWKKRVSTMMYPLLLYLGFSPMYRKYLIYWLPVLKRIGFKWKKIRWMIRRSIPFLVMFALLMVCLIMMYLP